MKTPSTIKTVTALFTTAALLSLSGHAQEGTTISTFNLTKPFSTDGYRTADWGLSARFTASDLATLPANNRPFKYAVSAEGIVDAKAVGIQFRAAEGKGTLETRANGSATISGSLTVVGRNIWSIRNKNVIDYNRAETRGSTPNSAEFVLEHSTSATYPFVLGFVPVNVTVKAKASLSAKFVATVTTRPVEAGTQVNLAVGPVVSAGATAEASVGVGVDGLASVKAGVSGTLRIGSAGVMANCSLIPLRAQNRTITFLRGSVTLNTKGPNGQIDVFAEGELGPIKHRVTQTIAEFSTPNIAPVILAGPINRRLF